MAVGQHQVDRLGRIAQAGGEVVRPGQLRFDLLTAFGRQSGIGDKARLLLDFGQQSRDRIGMVFQGRAGLGGRQRQGMDLGHAGGERRQLLRQLGWPPDNLLHHQSAEGQPVARRQDTGQLRAVAALAHPREAGRLIAQVVGRRIAALALLGNAQQEAGAGQPQMVVGQALVGELGKRAIGQRTQAWFGQQPAFDGSDKIRRQFAGSVCRHCGFGGHGRADSMSPPTVLSAQPP